MPLSNTITVARACCAGLALVVLPASLVEAAFGPRTTLGKNYQQWSSETSVVQTFTPGSCNSHSGCFVLFQAIPQQQALLIQHVACRAIVGAGGLRYANVYTRKGQTIVNTATYLVPVHTTGTSWVVNNPVMHLLKSGERPLVFLFNSQATSWTVDCSISGKLM